MREKSQVFSIFLKWKNLVENQSGYLLKTIRSRGVHKVDYYLRLVLREAVFNLLNKTLSYLLNDLKMSQIVF